jgi:hypothetical protein
MGDWLKWILIGGGGILSAWGQLKAGSDAESYYSQLADIQSQNAAIDKANADMATSATEARATWAEQAGDIDLENQAFMTEYKTVVAQNEKAFNDYMAALTRRQEAEVIDIAAGVYAGEKEIAEETEVLKQKDAQLAYDEKMDQVRHIVAETAARGGKGGFKINAGSFMSALRDQTSIGDMYATGARESAFEMASINKESAILNADTSYKQRMMTAEGMEGTALRYDLAGKINLEEEKLAGALFGGAVKTHGISESAYDFIMGQSAAQRILNEQRYGINVNQADITRRQGESAKEGSYYGAGGSLLNAFGRALYGAKG